MKNHPKFIIISFTDKLTLDEIEIDKFNKGYQPIPLLKSNEYKPNMKAFSFTQCHYYIDNMAVTHSSIPEDLMVYHPFCNNAIHIACYNKYNFKIPSNKILTSLYLKIFELQQKYNIPVYNIMSDFDTKLQLGEIQPVEWTSNTSYNKNTIFKAPDGVVYQVINNDFNESGVLHGDFINGGFNGSFTDIDVQGGHIKLLASDTKVYPNDRIYLYDIDEDSIGDSTETLIKNIIENGIFSVTTVELPPPFGGDTGLILNQRFTVPSGYDIVISGKYYTKIKPISDFDIRHIFTNDYLR